MNPNGTAVYAAIHAVSTALGKAGIEKARSNAQQGFKFRGIDDVLLALSPLLAEHGLLILPAVIKIETQAKGQTAKGASIFDSIVTVEYTLIAVADGSSCKVVFAGEGMDSGDKSISKALSIAYKQMAFQTFCIPCEGMDDPDTELHEVFSGASHPIPSPSANVSPQPPPPPPADRGVPGGAEPPPAEPSYLDLRAYRQNTALRIGKALGVNAEHVLDILSKSEADSGRTWDSGEILGCGLGYMRSVLAGKIRNTPEIMARAHAKAVPQLARPSCAGDMSTWTLGDLERLAAAYLAQINNPVPPPPRIAGELFTTDPPSSIVPDTIKKEGKNKGRTFWKIKWPDGKRANCFSSTHEGLLSASMLNKTPCRVEFERSGEYLNIVSVEGHDGRGE